MIKYISINVPFFSTCYIAIYMWIKQNACYLHHASTQACYSYQRESLTKMALYVPRYSLDALPHCLLSVLLCCRKEMSGLDVQFTSHVYPRFLFILAEIVYQMMSYALALQMCWGIALYVNLFGCPTILSKVLDWSYFPHSSLICV